MSTIPLSAPSTFGSARASVLPQARERELPAAANVLLFGAGVVGSEVVRQVHAFARSPRLTGPDVRIVGLANRRSALFDKRGVSVSDATELCRGSAVARRTRPTPFDVAAWRTHVAALSTLPAPVLIDCTDAREMEVVYEEALARGVSVVTANKEPLVAPAERLAYVRQAARQSGAQLRYEATVGAALPVVGTLQSLVRTGDRIDVIDCAVSGTLAHLTHALRRGVPLSRALDEAIALGLTEPHPADDLAGHDVARKAVILAREVGIAVELDDVEIEPFVPRSVLEAIEAGGTAALECHDAECAEHVARLAANGATPAYLARIVVEQDPNGKLVGRIRVGFEGVSRHHPAATLGAGSAAVAFYTARYGEDPLVVQGAGAGGSVTAAAVLAEVLDVARPLRRAHRH